MDFKKKKKEKFLYPISDLEQLHDPHDVWLAFLVVFHQLRGDRRGFCVHLWHKGPFVPAINGFIPSKDENPSLDHAWSSAALVVSTKIYHKCFLLLLMNYHITKLLIFKYNQLENIPKCVQTTISTFLLSQFSKFRNALRMVKSSYTNTKLFP